MSEKDQKNYNKNRISDAVINAGKVTLTSLVALGLLGIPVGAFAHFVNGGIINKNLQNAENDIVEARDHLGTTIASATDLSNFDIASVEVGTDLNKYILKAFGSISAEQITGIKENQYVNIMFNITQNEAENILKLANKLDETDLIVDRDTTEHNVEIEVENSMRFSESSRIAKAKDACMKLYSALETAVVNSYSHMIEEISESSSMNNSISNAYRYSRPEFIGDTNVSGLFANGSTTFINSGVMTTSISQVVRDSDRGVSYFLIDTLQGRENNGDIILESCRARVEVEGTDISQEEVYAKFIKGEHTKFVEIVREKVGEKTGIIDNELHTDVEEIEFLN